MIPVAVELHIEAERSNAGRVGAFKLLLGGIPRIHDSLISHLGRYRVVGGIEEALFKE